MARVPASPQERLLWPLLPPSPCLPFSPSQDSPAVIAAPDPCPALYEWAWLGGHGDQGRRPSAAEPEAPNLALSSECKIEHCEACFSHNFCTKCKESLYLHKGRCYPTCPEGSAAANGTMECSSPGKAGRRGGQTLRPRFQDPGGGAGWGGLARASVGWALCSESASPPPSELPLRTLLPSGLKTPLDWGCG